MFCPAHTGQARFPIEQTSELGGVVSVGKGWYAGSVAATGTTVIVEMTVVKTSAPVRLPNCDEGKSSMISWACRRGKQPASRPK